MTILPKGNYVGLVMLLEEKMLSSWLCTKRHIGAPEFTYGRRLYKSLTKADVDVKNWHGLALDKSKWRKMIYDI